ncbi:MAG: site-specific integrase [Chitinophagales bacterium]|jgi:integrase|nr:site-specific integrase [Chitinophagales bacterium]
MSIKVSLRKKAISKNRQSLYLDFYPPITNFQTGQPTRREFLGIYIYDKPKNPVEKQHNKETLLLAEQIKQKRENFLNKPEVYSNYELEQLKIKELGERNFVEYFQSLTNKRKASNHDNWLSAFKYLNTYTNGSLRFADLNEKFGNDFKEYLLTVKSNKSDKVTLSQNSAASYFIKFKAALKQAFKDGLLQIDLNAKIEPIKQLETQRDYLTVDELNRLIKTDCINPLLKRAAIFSALTGLRFSDIQKLIWGEIQFDSERGYSIQFTQQKTKGVEVLPISEQAYQLLGEPQDATERVFKGLHYSAYENQHLYQWIKIAGITKDISFHNFRHTFATLQLSKGTDIVTVGKMLGHKGLKTTQIYVKIVDENKRKAADKIKLDF